LLLIGFWRGFRSDELIRLAVENITVTAGEGMVCYLTQTKTNRQYRGTPFKVPALVKLCPVKAYLEWKHAAQLINGPVFRSIDRWGPISEEGLHVDSVALLLRSILSDAGISSSELYSSHSLRRGFANCAVASGWDIKTLMSYVGWKDVR
jgi:site-specific recombinase XerD